VVYGNTVALADRYLLPEAWPFPAVLGPLAVVLLLLWAMGKEKLTWQELGLGPSRSLLSGVWGFLVGLVLAGIALIFLRFPLLVSDPIQYTPLEGLEARGVLLRVLVTMPLDTVLVEEVAFRGVLLALFLRSFSTKHAVLLSSLVFMLWHLVVNYHTLTNTNLAWSPFLLALGLVGAHVAVFLGGVFFCVLRLGFGRLAPCISAHWAVNGGILVGLLFL
jgi:membrane protease YdiL (CAAX protease family)